MTQTKADVDGDTSVGPVSRRPTRQERAAATRRRILEAAAKVVGRHGYADASIARITEEADIAQGTFYLYFSSRQELFDVLLPHVGKEMMKYLGTKVRGATSYYEVEERGFRAFFDYLQRNPGFFRVLNEAEVAAPVAHAEHVKVLTEAYVRSLTRAVKNGEIKNFDESELETIASIFEASRSYLYLSHVKHKNNKELPESVVQTYMKFVRGGLQ